MMKTRRMIKKSSESVLKKHKIRLCYVKLNRLDIKDLVFEKALYKWHRIRNLKVEIKRLSKDELKPKPTKKKFLTSPKVQSVRAHVNWLPALKPMPNGAPKTTTMIDFHSELLEKVGTPNRSLRSASERLLPDAKPKIVPEWQLIFDEFQEIAAAKQESRIMGNIN